MRPFRVDIPFFFGLLPRQYLGFAPFTADPHLVRPIRVIWVVIYVPIFNPGGLKPRDISWSIVISVGVDYCVYVPFREDVPPLFGPAGNKVNINGAFTIRVIVGFPTGRQGSHDHMTIAIIPYNGYELLRIVHNVTWIVFVVIFQSARIDSINGIVVAVGVPVVSVLDRVTGEEASY
jgi:hypothetical protein